jgi:hypothetical protein
VEKLNEVRHRYNQGATAAPPRRPVAGESLRAQDLRCGLQSDDEPKETASTSR